MFQFKKPSAFAEGFLNLGNFQYTNDIHPLGKRI